MTPNSMLEHLLHGQFDVDPASIGKDGFLRNGKTYAYFGIGIAIPRLPLIAINALGSLDITRLACAFAVTVALSFKLASVLLIYEVLPKSRLRAIGFSLLVVSLLFSGAQIQFLKSSVYQEVVAWSGAIAAAFVYCGVRGLIKERQFSTGLVSAMATLAGLGLLTRVSTGLGLYVATGLLVLVLAWPVAGPLRKRLLLWSRALVGGRTVICVAILVGFALLCGYVNYQRWGNPLQFADMQRNIFYMADPSRIVRQVTYGAFNIERLWYGILYYFLPGWTFVGANGQLLFSKFEIRMLDGVEVPPGSFLLSDPLLLILAGIGLVRLPQLGRERLIDLQAVAALMIGLSIPAFLILTYTYMAFRYRMEFYPFFEFAAYLGFYAICVKPSPFSVSSRSILLALLITSAIIGVVFSHLWLFLYKISPFGDYKYQAMGGHEIVTKGWLAFYWDQLKIVFPSLAERFSN